MGVDSEFQSLGLAVNEIGLDWGWDGIEGMAYYGGRALGWGQWE